MAAATRYRRAAEPCSRLRVAAHSLCAGSFYAHLLERRGGPALDLRIFRSAWVLLSLAELAHCLYRVAFGFARAGPVGGSRASVVLQVMRVLFVSRITRRIDTISLVGGIWLSISAYGFSSEALAAALLNYRQVKSLVHRTTFGL